VNARATGHPVRVLFVADALSYNGAILTAVDLVPRFAARGAPTELFVLFPVERAREVKVDPATRITLGVSGHRRFRWAFPQALARLVLSCRRANVVVSASEVGPALLLGSFAALLARRPFVVMIHADLRRAVEQWVPAHLRPLTHFVHRHAEAALCISPTLVEPVLASGLDPRRAHVVPNGVDVEHVRALAREEPSIEPAAVPRIVTLGRLSPEKGLDLLLRAHAEVRSAGAEHELVIIGEGPEAKSLRALAHALGVDSSVHLLGLLANPFPVVAAASAFVLPSRREGLSLALLEALALGVPVIATSCSAGVEEALDHGRYGELVEANAVAPLSAALQQHLGNPDTLRVRAQAAWKEAGRYHVDETALRSLEILRALVDRRKRGDGN
jgi:glycosyltransferase involved in cell wall biosynthesis